MVPEPPVPEMGGSSPWWGMAVDITMSLPAPQKPFSPAVLSALHLWGQRVQWENTLFNLLIISLNAILIKLLVFILIFL